MFKIRMRSGAVYLAKKGDTPTLASFINYLYGRGVPVVNIVNHGDGATIAIAVDNIESVEEVQ